MGWQLRLVLEVENECFGEETGVDAILRIFDKVTKRVSRLITGILLLNFELYVFDLKDYMSRVVFPGID